MATASPDPRPSHIPGHERHEGQCPCHCRHLQLIAEGLRNAHGTGTKLRPTPILGKAHAIPAQAGKKDSFALCERGVDQGATGHLMVGRRIGEDEAGRPELLELRSKGRDHVFGRAELDGSERPPPAAHLLPDQWFRAVHPASIRIGTGAVSRLSGHAIELHCAGSRRCTLPVTRRVVTAPGLSRRPQTEVRASNTWMYLVAVLQHHSHLNRPIGPAAACAACAGRFCHPFRTVFSFAPAVVPSATAFNRSDRRSIVVSISEKFCRSF